MSALDGLRPCIKEGPLSVESHKAVKFKPRFLALKEDAIYCFLSPAGLAIKSVIPLGPGSKVLDLQSGPGLLKGFFFVITARCTPEQKAMPLFEGSEREYHIRAETDDEKMMWMNAIAFICLGNVDAAKVFAGQTPDDGAEDDEEDEEDGAGEGMWDDDDDGNDVVVIAARGDSPEPSDIAPPIPKSRPVLRRAATGAVPQRPAGPPPPRRPAGPPPQQRRAAPPPPQEDNEADPELPPPPLDRSKKPSGAPEQQQQQPVVVHARPLQEQPPAVTPAAAAVYARSVPQSQASPVSPPVVRARPLNQQPQSPPTTPAAVVQARAVPVIAQPVAPAVVAAQRAPLQTSNSAKWTICHFCRGAVVQKELVVADGKNAHFYCFKCAGCSKELDPNDPSSWRKMTDKVYLCLPHYEMEMQMQMQERERHANGAGDVDAQHDFKYAIDWKTKGWKKDDNGVQQ